MKIIALLIIIITGSLPLSAQTLAPKSEPTEIKTITSTDISTKAVNNLTRKRLTADKNNSMHFFRSKRVIKTLGEVYLTAGQSFSFTAGDSIVLGPGFEVDSTTEFTAEIQNLTAETKATPALALTSPEVLEKNAGTLKAFTLYPNPASEQFNIEYEVNKTAMVSLALFTLEGTPVQDFVTAKQQEPGSYKLALPVNNIPSGIYVVSLKINNQTISQRVVLR